MNGVNRHTLWTWNSVGKRSGAWSLAPGVPEVGKSFLLNHIIGKLLPAREGGHRYSNSDPITGQAAWYDLKVRIEKAEGGEALTLPQFPTVKAQRGPRSSLHNTSPVPFKRKPKVGESS
jgi:sulfite dehydrogenase (quinone) subunit SoeA